MDMEKRKMSLGEGIFYSVIAICVTGLIMFTASHLITYWDEKI
jgi:hypothetical protein